MSQTPFRTIAAFPGYSTKLVRSAAWPLMLFAMFGLIASVAFGAEDDEARAVHFRKTIEPVLQRECLSCHSSKADEVQGGLKLDSRAAWLRGGDSGAVIVPGKPNDSLLLQALKHADGMAMPPKKKLSDQTIADFEKWIAEGAFDPRSGTAPTFDDEIKAARSHWSFQPIKKPQPPIVSDTHWGRSPLDAFVLEKLAARHWRPASAATKADLIRRVSFDLIGLPPTPAEVATFVNDSTPDAYERLVDRLLASRHYGEKWATHWLDVVRFAESEGYEYDRHIPDAWRFRDYVIESLQRDKPFDQFLTEQIAGDELAESRPAGDPLVKELLSAAIFHRLGPVRRNAGNPDIALSRNEVLTERTDIIGSAILGLTVGCARCHNHKLEPIAQRDYYRLQAYFAATQEHNLSLASPDLQQQWEAETARLKARIAELQAKAKGLTGPKKDELDTQIEALSDQLPEPLATIPTIRNESAKRTAMHVLKRGVWEQKGEPVGPRPLSVLVPDDLTELSSEVTQPRTKLAQWLTSSENPLTARVIVNRVWQQHFGTGLVKTANDFGLNGERPSHPELLDWLAATFIESGWRLKPLHRLIVLSNTYQMSSAPEHAPPTAATDDPENRWLSHFSRRRLSAEEVRDAMLFVSGQINLKAGGPSVLVPVDPELVALLYKPAQWAVTKETREHNRRSIYLMAKRNLRLPFFESLDAPALLASCGRREASTHPPQALELLNGRLANELAAAFALRLERETDGDRPRLIQRAYELAMGRHATDREQIRAIEFLREQPVSEFALAVFNLHGFLYVP